MWHDRLMRLVHGLAERSGLAQMVAFYLNGLHAEHKLSRGGRLLFRIRHSHWYAVAVGLLAVISAGTSLYPFGPVIVGATVFAPGRWRGVILGATLGAAIGATTFIVVVQNVGVALVDDWFPGIRTHAIWTESAYWIERHGELALGLIAALPVPQMPALIASALGEMHPAAVFIALLCGKGVKYTVYVLGVLLLLKAMRHVAEWREPPPA